MIDQDLLSDAFSVIMDSNISPTSSQSSSSTSPRTVSITDNEEICEINIRRVCPGDTIDMVKLFQVSH